MGTILARYYLPRIYYTSLFIAEAGSLHKSRPFTVSLEIHFAIKKQKTKKVTKLWSKKIKK